MPTIITRGAVSAKAYGFGVSGGYSVGKSLRFRSSASAYLNRTPASSGNRQIFTFSFWIKRGILGASEGIYHCNDGTQANSARISFSSADQLNVEDGTSGTSFLLQTSQVFRDPSAWYHIVLAVDTTQATAANRARLYINGSLVTSFASVSYPAQNGTTCFNQNIATQWNRAYFFGAAAYAYGDQYFAEFNFIDGQSLAASSFGAYDTNGVWQPAKYSGTYGTNGFYLTFGNTTSTATLGNDSSGNSNTWTVNNISLTAGATYDSMTDSPTVSSASVANYAVMNPTSNSTASNSFTFSNGNLQASATTSGGGRGITGSVAMLSGKFYAEFVVTSWGSSSNADIGILRSDTTVMTTSSFAASGCIGTYLSNGYAINQGGTVANNGTNLATGLTTYTTSDVVQIAYDATNGKLYFGKNNTWLNSANPSAGTGGFSVTTGYGYLYAFGVTSNGSQTGTVVANFGQQPFTYTPPTGFNALNTYNLPTPTIANGAQYMAASTWTGNGSTQTITNSGNNTIGTTFQPDFVWLKSRSGAFNHYAYDSVRGALKELYPNLTNAEFSNTVGLSSFNSNGFTLNSGDNGWNANAATYVGWQWKAGGSSGVSNTNGSITSTVSANTTAGFSVVTYTGTGTSNPTIGHGLGVAPNMIILKDRNTNSQNNNWQVYHSSLTSGYFLSLNATDAQAAISGTSYGSVGQPTSTTFTGVAGSVNSTTTNQNTQLYVAYCWAAVAGYSAFGSYTGNGSADGPFVYTGFRPRWIMAKDVTNTTSASWLIQDTSRDTYNVGYKSLYAEQTSVESVSSADNVDILSNGFKIRNASSGWNNSGQTFIYIAFAENPFNTSRAR
jgi:hypothetical protein